MAFFFQGMGQRKLVDENLQKVSQLKELAERLGGTVAQLAIAWCARNPDVSTVILGATSEKQVSWSLSATPPAFAWRLWPGCRTTYG